MCQLLEMASGFPEEQRCQMVSHSDGVGGEITKVGKKGAGVLKTGHRIPASARYQ